MEWMYFTPVGARSAPGLPRGMRRAGDYLLSYILYTQSSTMLSIQNIPQIKPNGSSRKDTPYLLAPPFELVFGYKNRSCGHLVPAGRCADQV